MSLTRNSFSKVIQTSVSGAEVTANVATRTYTTTRVEDVSTVAVYFNGQEIPSNGLTTSKYYCIVTPTLTPPTVDLGLNIVPTDTSSITFTIHANQAYTGIGYGSGTSEVKFSTSDTFIIQYYYVIYTAN